MLKHYHQKDSVTLQCYDNFLNGIVKSLVLGTAVPWASSALGTDHLFGCISLPAQPHRLTCSTLGTSLEAGEPPKSACVVAGSPSAAEQVASLVTDEA